MSRPISPKQIAGRLRRFRDRVRRLDNVVVVARGNRDAVAAELAAARDMGAALSEQTEGSQRAAILAVTARLRHMERKL